VSHAYLLYRSRGWLSRAGELGLRPDACSQHLVSYVNPCPGGRAVLHILYLGDLMTDTRDLSVYMRRLLNRDHKRVERIHSGTVVFNSGATEQPVRENCIERELARLVPVENETQSAAGA